jgi:uncharacterized protein YjbI with pentapeptide repeats
MKQTYTKGQTFTGINFQKTTFEKGEYENCSFINCDFSNTDLSEVIFIDCRFTGPAFDNCDLAGATFDNTNLEKTNFATAFNYSIDPERNRIKKAKFSVPVVLGLLNKYDIAIEN